MKSRSFSLIAVFILLLSLLSNAVNTITAYALSNTPLVNMPTTNGDVLVIVPDGTGGVYIGGYFTQLTPISGGSDIARNNIAHINADGSIDLMWNPDSNAIVFAITVSGNTVYVGGGFTTIGGQNRNRIAALAKTTGNATAWNPNANDYVYTISLNGSTVYVGGDFTNIGGQNRSSIAALDAATGSATAWDPNANGSGIPLSNPYVKTLVVSGGTIYVGGWFTNVGGQTRNNIAALDITTGNVTVWDPNANLDVATLEVSGGIVYVGGYFTSIGGQSRNHIAALDMTSGSALPWNPNANDYVYTIWLNGSNVYAGGKFTNVGGQNRNNIAALDATTSNATVWNPNANSQVLALAISGNTLYTGGYFTTIGGQTRPNFAAFSLETTVFNHYFGDVPMSHPYWEDIETLYANGLTAGCSTSPLLFCPDTVMDRAQSAVFMLRGNLGVGYVPPNPPFGSTFGDSWGPGPWAQKWAQGMLQQGLTAGCSSSPLLYCPWEAMPRLQAAVFGMRLMNGNAYVPPAATGTVFADLTDTSLWYTKWAEQAYLNGLLPACGTSGGKPLFCPNDLVSRGLGAYMIVRAKNLTMP